MQQWHLDIQHELFRNTVATVSYVGTKGTHLTLQQDLNQLYPVPASQNPFQPGQPITAAVCTPDSNGVYTVNNTRLLPGIRYMAIFNALAATIPILIVPTILDTARSPTSPLCQLQLQCAAGFGSPNPRPPQPESRLHMEPLARRRFRSLRFELRQLVRSASPTTPAPTSISDRY